MMKYKIHTTHGAHPPVQVAFEEQKYALIGEMLLAERAFLDNIIAALDAVLKDAAVEANSFSGNAFSMFVTAENTKITNDINGEETEAPTKDLKKLAKGYKKQYERIQR